MLPSPSGTDTALYGSAAGETETDAKAETNKKQLTERQLQFWEDVDDGLDGIEDYYGSGRNGREGEGVDIDRIRRFALR